MNGIENPDADKDGTISLQNFPKDWSIEARISHRIVVYVSKHGMNQLGIEEIIKEELPK